MLATALPLAIQPQFHALDFIPSMNSKRSWLIGSE
jgi:hypothetical protein